MKKLSLVFLILTLAACGSSSNNTPKDKFIVENLTNYNAEDLAKSYPDANIYEGNGMFEEASVDRAFSVMYPDSPDELHITWKDKERNEIFDIRFSGKGKWKSAKGIQIGTTYEALNKLNGKEIAFYGFGWDYSGAVMWNNGKFEDSNLRVFLSPQDEVNNKFYGDHIIEATEEEIMGLNLKVTNIILIN